MPESGGKGKRHGHERKRRKKIVTLQSADAKERKRSMAARQKGKQRDVHCYSHDKELDYTVDKRLARGENGSY